METPRQVADRLVERMRTAVLGRIAAIDDLVFVHRLPPLEYPDELEVGIDPVHEPEATVDGIPLWSDEQIENFYGNPRSN